MKRYLLELFDEIFTCGFGMIFAEIKVKHKVRKAGRFSCFAIRNGNIRNSFKFQRGMIWEKVWLKGRSCAKGWKQQKNS